MREAMIANGYRDMLYNRSPDAVRHVLNHLAAGKDIVVHEVEGYENASRDEHFWVIRFGIGMGSLWRKPMFVAMVRVPVNPLRSDVNPMSEFYRRAEKRLKLFAELCRD